MLPATRDGRTCRSQAPSSRCSGASSRLAGTTRSAQTGEEKAKSAHEVVPPSRVLDGFGSFIAPPSTARPVPTDFTGSATADHPPGFYGPPESLFAVNTLAAADRLAPLDFAPLANATREVYRTSEPLDLRGPILLAALALFLLDTLVVLFLGGGIQRLIPRTSRAAAAGGDRLFGARAPHSCTHAPRRYRVRMCRLLRSETRLAYVVTGNSEVDTISKAGLGGLTLFLAQRTALEAGEPMGLDIAHDELAFIR